MARIRTIKPEFWSSLKVGRVSRDARLFFLGLLNEADDEGRLIGQSKRLAGIIFPYDDDIDAKKIVLLIAELQRAGLLVRYEVSGAVYLSICGFSEHQKIDRRQASRLPAPPTSEVSESPVISFGCDESEIPPDKSAESTDRTGEPADLLVLEQGTGNRERDLGNGRGIESAETETRVALPSEAIASRAPCRTVMEVLEFWNSSMNQKCQMTAKRQKIVKQRLRDVLWVASWREGVVRAVASDFCQGHNDRNWVADFEWFIRPDSVTKLLEGKYDNRGTTAFNSPKPIKASESPEYAGLKRL